MGLVPNKSRISSGRAKTTMDIERKRASLELGLLYRYATTHLLGLASILEHLRFSFFTSALSIPVVRSGKEGRVPSLVEICLRDNSSMVSTVYVYAA
jgi:hypothetical protein